jgi:hypothetical protein
MERDVIWGMQVDPKKAAGSSESRVRPTTSAAQAANVSSIQSPEQYAKS